MFKLDQILLAQNSQEIMEDLANSEARLEDLGEDLDVVRGEYLNLVQEYNASSFFNIDNIYFWFLVVGLILLLFGLLYLLLELKQGQDIKKKSKDISPKNNFEESVIKIHSEASKAELKSHKQAKKSKDNLANISKNIDAEKRPLNGESKVNKKVIKIKVIKVK